MIMDPIIGLILGIAGGVVLLLMAVIGFFMARVVKDVKSNISEIGKNKGRIELVEQQQLNDIKRIEENTQLKLGVMSDSVTQLSSSVNTLITALATKGMKDE
jgi:t-SNARE complex subunit (syntaxin)